MIEIIKSETWPLSFYSGATENEETKYKLSDYVFIEECDDGYLLLHTISWSLFFLSKEEYDNILLIDYFKKHKIVLDENVDEDEIAKKTYLARGTYKKLPTYDKINSFVIFTTNKCNAQCFYCYEKDSLPQIGMTLKTADDVINFIIEKNNNTEINIQWFGGEPLLNTKVIDYICQKLKDNNIVFTSSAISNAILLTEQNIDKAINLWNLKRIQITIDGVGEKYNEIKNYKNKSINAFEKVVENIGNTLLTEKIYISIRINVSFDNLENCREIVKFFNDYFGDYIKKGILSVYTHEIFQITKKEMLDEIEKQLLLIKSEFPFLTVESEKKSILTHSNLLYCMGDGGRSLVISPTGELGVCEHWNPDVVIGSIYSGITNVENVEKWQDKSGKNIEYCTSIKCKYLPMCKHLNICPNFRTCEDEYIYSKKIKNLLQNMRFTYDEYLKLINKKGEE